MTLAKVNMSISRETRYANMAYLLLLVTLCCLSLATAQPNRRWHQRQQGQTNTQITDFRYKSARIDGITRLFNDSLIVISNGHYWLLASDEMPRAYNVKGPISELYSGMADQIDAIWTDPYNDISPQIYLVSNVSPSLTKEMIYCSQMNLFDFFRAPKKAFAWCAKNSTMRNSRASLAFAICPSVLPGNRHLKI